MPHQVGDAGGMLQSLRRHGAALNAGETGTGKTYSCMAVARELSVAPVVVCPKAVMPSWQKVAEAFGGQCHTINYEKLTGKMGEFGGIIEPAGLKPARAEVRRLQALLDEYRETENILAGISDGGLTEAEFQALRTKYPNGWYHEHSTALQKAKALLKHLNSRRKFVWNQEIPLIVFDEGHRCKGRGTLNSKALAAAKEQRIPVVVASATAAKDPLEMYALGYALGLHNKDNFWQWAHQYGCEPGDHGGLVFHGGKPALKRLHAQIFPHRGVRTTRDAIPGFPETQITAEVYSLPEEKEIDALYEEMRDALGRLDSRMQKDRDLEHPLTQLLRARQRLEILKAPLFVELAEDGIEEGMSVAIFVNFEETLREVCSRLKTTCTVDGSQVGPAGARTRQFNIDLFNSGESRLIVCNTKAGGVGVSLHDLKGDFPRLALISPTYSAVDLIQVLGRVWRAGGKSKSLQRIVLAANTVEERIQKQLQGKLNNLSLINDGDLIPLFS